MRRAFGALRVELNNEGEPQALYFGHKRVSVKRVLDVWLYGGRWWRSEAPRTYYLLQLGDGTDVEIYQEHRSKDDEKENDEEGDRWLLSRKGD